MHKDKNRQFVCEQVIEMEYYMSLIVAIMTCPHITVRFHGILEFKYKQ
jgi:hypothetical protein